MQNTEDRDFIRYLIYLSAPKD